MSEPLNPDDFVITRRRKKFKFAMFANSSLCFELDEWKQAAIDVVEVGAGTGFFSVELASRHPEQTFLAVDVKGDRLQKGAYEAEARNLTNIRFLRARADQLLEVVKPGSVSQVWLTFPDPFPKKRSANRRLTNKTFLYTYTKMLNKSGSLYLKHDSREFFMWSLEQLVAYCWHIDELSFDLHDSDLSDDYKILTSYETRWLGEGLVTNFVSAHVPKNQ
ncbi:TPA: tRNA (guanosine(46)-N7)-methyltransferase TrmB [Candidatus Saccharibacteria bacterium]|nr:tRNA (guanosine(46)-N7)-methyltransferase TrmB [Candidatus Saccharibacteria bacterium]HRK40474.1 tRNA (guanosine(46)-N7)-methyltransferase TrmB [Candidatus Saccharibacteria bacterium]